MPKSILVGITPEMVVVHQVFRVPREGPKKPPLLSEHLTNLNHEALQLLTVRLNNALGRDSKCVDMKIAASSDGTCVDPVRHILASQSEDHFLDQSKIVPRIHDSVQTTASIPGGLLIVIKGRCGIPERPCMFVVKAEIDKGFRRNTKGADLGLEYLNDIVLTPNAKLFKIAAFVLKDEADPKTINTSDIEPYLFDSNISSADETRAAKYFYRDFLGLEFPENAKKMTRDFFDHSRTWINDSGLNGDEKFDLHNALYTYLKAAQQTTVSVQDFGGLYIRHDLRDSFKNSLYSKGVATNHFRKDLSSIKSKLRRRKMKFSHGVLISGSPEAFEKSVKILENNADRTVLEIDGPMIEQ